MRTRCTSESAYEGTINWRISREMSYQRATWEEEATDKM